MGKYIGLTIIIFIVIVVSFVLLETDAVNRVYAMATSASDIYSAIENMILLDAKSGGNI